MTQKFDIVICEVAFLFYDGHSNIPKGFQHLVHMFQMFFQSLQIDNNIIDICQCKVQAVHAKNSVHYSLKVRRCIFQTERNMQALIEAILSDETSEFPAIFIYPHLMVTTIAVDCYKVVCATKSSEHRVLS